jgi:hypothetical protein
MALFLENYVRYPLQSLLAEASDILPDFSAIMRDGNILLSIGDESLSIVRSSQTILADSPMHAEDVGDQIPGP